MQVSYKTLQPNWHVAYIVGGNPAEQKYAFFKSLHIAAYDLLSILFVRDHPFMTSSFLGGRGQKLDKFADGQ